MWDALGDLLTAVFDGVGSKRRTSDEFQLRAVIAPPGSAARREDFTHCWVLQNAAVKKGARDVTFAWRRGPDGKPAAAIQLGDLPMLRTVPLDGITWPSQRPPVSAEVSWTDADGGHRKTTLHLD